MVEEIIYPGTFDPITNGHLDLVERARRLCRRVIVAVAVNALKQTIFTAEERVAIIKAALVAYPDVEVCSFEGLLVTFAIHRGVNTILRGLRAVSDFEYELQLANINRRLEPAFETLFLAPSEQFTYISSSTVREIASLGGEVSHFVPPSAEIALKNKFASQFGLG